MPETRQRREDGREGKGINHCFCRNFLMTQIQGGKNIQDARKKGTRNHEEAEGGVKEREREREKEVRLKGKRTVSLFVLLR